MPTKPPPPTPTQAAMSSHIDAKHVTLSINMFSCHIFNRLLNIPSSSDLPVYRWQHVTVAHKSAPKLGWNLSKQDHFSRSHRASEIQREVSNVLKLEFHSVSLILAYFVGAHPPILCTDIPIGNIEKVRTSPCSSSEDPSETLVTLLRLICLKERLGLSYFLRSVVRWEQRREELSGVWQ